jgi:hypothetical protein
MDFLPVRGRQQTVHHRIRAIPINRIAVGRNGSPAGAKNAAAWAGSSRLRDQWGVGERPGRFKKAFERRRVCCVTTSTPRRAGVTRVLDAAGTAH